MEHNTFHGTLSVDTDICIGCSHCMRVCPTEALRVKGGKALLYADWCIECGECFKVCPVRAIQVRDDDFSEAQTYDERVILVPAVFYTQFPKSLTPDIVDEILSDMGFTNIVTVEQSVDSLVSEINTYVDNAPEKPIISCFCPAVIRLIQVRFPALLDRIMLMLPPLEITAMYYHKKHKEAYGDDKSIGIFYITPCIAKTAAIKSPIGGYSSPITGVLNMDFVYNKVMAAYKSKSYSGRTITASKEISSRGVLWPTTGGESSFIEGSALAIDGLYNVIEFLERLEDEELGEGLDYIELRICDESCAGGILTQSNRFVMADTLRKKAKTKECTHSLTSDYKRIISENFKIDSIEPRSMIKYDKDINKAIKKMEMARMLRDVLPDIDCGACGAPSCEALAADIVRDDAILSNCIFMQAIYEKEGSLKIEEAIELMEKVWGNERFINKRK